MVASRFANSLNRVLVGDRLINNKRRLYQLSVERCNLFLGNGGVVELVNL